MQDADYEILEWVLGECNPMVVTLEYFREQEPLEEQLWRLRDLLSVSQDLHNGQNANHKEHEDKHQGNR